MTDIIQELYQTILSRRREPVEKSYTNYLFEQGLDKICKKVGEECAEVIIAAKNGDPEGIVCEVSDVLYHLLVLMAEQGVEWDEVRGELEQRARKIGNAKERRDVDKDT